MTEDIYYALWSGTSSLLFARVSSVSEIGDGLTGEMTIEADFRSRHQDSVACTLRPLSVHNALDT